MSYETYKRCPVSHLIYLQIYPHPTPTQTTNPITNPSTANPLTGLLSAAALAVYVPPAVTAVTVVTGPTVGCVPIILEISPAALDRAPAGSFSGVSFATTWLLSVPSAFWRSVNGAW